MAFRLLIAWLFVLVGRPQDFLTFLAPLRLALLLTLANLMLMAVDTPKDFSKLFKEKYFRRYLLFYAVMVVGILFAYHRRMAFNLTIMTYSVNILFFIIFIARVDSLEKLRAVFLTLAVSLMCYGIFAVLKGRFVYGRLFVGGMFDPNDLAYFCLSLIPFCLYFVLKSGFFIKKYLAITAVFFALSVTFLTGSRGGLLGLLAVVLGILFSRTGLIQKKQKVFVVVLMLVSVLAYASKIDVQRLSTITDLESDYNVTGEQGRLGIWGKGFDLFLENPIIGVGPDCFAMAIGYMRAAQGEIPKWQVAHNAYVQILAETGLLGSFFFLKLIIQCFQIGRKVQHRRAKGPDTDELKLMTACTTWAFIGHLTSALFLTQGYSILFTMFFAIYVSYYFRLEAFDKHAEVTQTAQSPMAGGAK